MIAGTVHIKLSRGGIPYKEPRDNPYPVKHKGSCGVEIVATGDELMYGRILDTNSNWIAKRLAELGANLRRVTMVGDDDADIIDALHEALHRDADIIVFTGGLGPSEDDFTVDSIGHALGRGVTYDPVGLEKIRGIYGRRGQTDLTRARRMTRVLEGSRALQNPAGMAVGMEIDESGKMIFTLPGVPQEMQAMFDLHIAPMIEGRARSVFLARTLSVSMVWMDFFPVYRQLQADYPDIYIKNAATPPEADEDRRRVIPIKVDIVLEAPSREEAEARMDALLLEYQRRIDAAGGGTIELR
jgi:molybdenum cofactor synthesis domain-containing protein